MLDSVRYFPTLIFKYITQNSYAYDSQPIRMEQNKINYNLVWEIGGTSLRRKGQIIVLLFTKHSFYSKYNRFMYHPLLGESGYNYYITET